MEAEQQPPAEEEEMLPDEVLNYRPDDDEALLRNNGIFIAGDDLVEDENNNNNEIATINQAEDMHGPWGFTGFCERRRDHQKFDARLPKYNGNFDYQSLF